ncbi:MAG: zinc permease [Actinomycetota bacterium]|nr:zinc permease [Actinomycetota bacterium]
MTQALLFGAVASGALLGGAALGSFWSPPEHLGAAALAFAGGALVSALAFELFAEADEIGGVGWAAVGMAAGGATYVLVDTHVLTRLRGSVASLGLLAAVTLDGIPENLALGVSLTTGASVALLAAIFASNFPEALGSAVRMREDGSSPAHIIGVWSVTAVLLAGSVVVGTLALEGAPGGLLAVLLGFAGGAVLASLSVTVFPQAFDHGGPYVAIATVGGFLFAYVLAEL